MFQISNFVDVGKLFLFLMGELLLLFIVISFIVALIQIYLSKEKIKRILIDKGVGYGTMVALIIGGASVGGAGASIPELSILNSIFKKKIMIAFVLSIFFVAVIPGYLFN